MYLYIICTILFSRLFNCCKFAECACLEVIDANPELYIYGGWSVGVALLGVGVWW